MQLPQNFVDFPDELYTSPGTREQSYIARRRSKPKIREISNCVWKVIRNCIGFALLRFVIGLENSRHPLNQSDAKLIKTNRDLVTRVFPRLIFAFVLIGHCDYFGFSLTTLNHKAFKLRLRPTHPFSFVNAHNFFRSHESTECLRKF